MSKWSLPGDFVTCRTKTPVGYDAFLLHNLRHKIRHMTLQDRRRIDPAGLFGDLWYGDIADDSDIEDTDNAIKPEAGNGQSEIQSDVDNQSNTDNEQHEREEALKTRVSVLETKLDKLDALEIRLNKQHKRSEAFQHLLTPLYLDASDRLGLDTTGLINYVPESQQGHVAKPQDERSQKQHMR